MKPLGDLDALLEKAKDKGIFGTKMRSVIKEANPAGVNAVVRQQFEIGRQIIAAGLVPIIEPEVDIHCPEKEQAEVLLNAALHDELDKLGAGEYVMLKLTLPEKVDLFRGCIQHANVLRVVALSGGYSRAEANDRLGKNHGMIASFSRALSEGLVGSAERRRVQPDARHIHPEYLRSLEDLSERSPPARPACVSRWANPAAPWVPAGCVRLRSPAPARFASASAHRAPATVDRAPGSGPP